MSFVSVEESGVQVAGEEAAPATIVGSAVGAVEESELRYIALSKLVPSPFNVRKSGGENIDELAMLIDSQGLLQNLVVIEHVTQAKKRTDKFEVVAGGRRLRALRKLADCGKIARDEEILCKVTTRDKALASSAAENSGREPMLGHALELSYVIRRLLLPFIKTALGVRGLAPVKTHPYEHSEVINLGDVFRCVPRQASV